MAIPYKVVVFDWDGTVMDTTLQIALGVQHAAKVMGFNVPSLNLARSVIGLDWYRALLKAVPDCPVARHEEFGQIYRDWYIPREREVNVYEGVEALLHELKAQNIQLAVATGKSRVGLDRVFALTGLESLFNVTCTADEYASKPNPMMLEHIALYCQCAPEDMVMLGDTDHDVGMAKAFGCDSVALTYGAQSREMLEKIYPTVICDDIGEVREFLKI